MNRSLRRRTWIGAMLANIFQDTLDALADTWQSTGWELHQRLTRSRDRRYVPVGLRREIMRRDKATCQICGKSGTETHGPDGRSWHIDHTRAIAQYGQTARYNLALTCAACNQRKAAK